MIKRVRMGSFAKLSERVKDVAAKNKATEK